MKQLPAVFVVTLGLILATWIVPAVVRAHCGSCGVGEKAGACAACAADPSGMCAQCAAHAAADKAAACAQCAADPSGLCAMCAAAKKDAPGDKAAACAACAADPSGMCAMCVAAKKDAAASDALPAAPAFTLTDTNGNTHNLADFAGQYVVLEWTNPDCPFVKKFYDGGHMQAWQQQFTGQGVVWLSICSSAEGKQGHYSPQEWNSRIAQKNIKATAVLLDSDGTVGRAYHATNTPHMFVINPDGKLIYQGAIDDNQSPDPAAIDGAHNYVASLLEAALTARTQAYGCSVKY